MKRGRTDQVSAIWTELLLAQALELRRQRMPYAQIDRQLGLRIGSTWVKLQAYQRFVEFVAWRAQRLPPEKLVAPTPTPRRQRLHIEAIDNDRRREPIPEAVLVERDALPPASLTAQLMGDPPPGRSALDAQK